MAQLITGAYYGLGHPLRAGATMGKLMTWYDSRAWTWEASWVAYRLVT
jgi:hypothetical protein